MKNNIEGIVLKFPEDIFSLEELKTLEEKLNKQFEDPIENREIMHNKDSDLYILTYQNVSGTKITLFAEAKERFSEEAFNNQRKYLEDGNSNSKYEIEDYSNQSSLLKGIIYLENTENSNDLKETAKMVKSFLSDKLEIKDSKSISEIEDKSSKRKSKSKFKLSKVIDSRIGIFPKKSYEFTDQNYQQSSL